MDPLDVGPAQNRPAWQAALFGKDNALHLIKLTPEEMLEILTRVL
jgi:hypothetical protein